MIYDKIYLIGNGKIADDCLMVLTKRNIPVELLKVCEEKFPFTEKLCARLNIRFKSFNKKEIKDFLLGLKEKTLVFSVHNSYIFPAEVCSKDNITILNLHIAFLPEYRGMNVPTWAIFNQEKYSGVTWHTVSSKIDNGNIIVQNRIEIEPDDTAMKLMMKCFKEGVRLFEDNLNSFLDCSYKSFVPKNPNTHLYLAKELPNNGYLSLIWNFDKTYAFLRSMDYKGANIMQLPRINYNGIIYEITKYKTINNGEYSNNKEIELNENLLCLKWGGVSIQCNLRKINGDN